ncbi:MAG: S9 family peptidase [Candidatus Eisenbacteria sp.]|nr:S9 family peptidase [Candidatus Eisenbacteria bacterium]
MRTRWAIALLLCGLSAAATGPAASATDPKSSLEREEYIPDIATFLNIGQASPAGYSWDGEDIYFTSSMSGASQVYRLTPAGWPYLLTAFEDGIDFFVLSFEGELAIVGASEGGSEQSQLYLMDPTTGRLRQITHLEDVQIGSVVWSRDDRSIFYRSNEENRRDFFIYEMDVVSGKHRKVFGDTAGVRGFSYIADISQDGSKLIVGNATSNVNNDLYLLDVASGRYQKLTEDEGDVVYAAPTLMPDGRTIWLTCNDNPDGISRLARLTVGNPEVEFVDDDWVDPRWEIDGLGLSRDYRFMVAFVNEDGYVRMRIREVESGRTVPSPPLEGILGGGYTDRHGRVLISFVGPTRAPDVWRWDPVRDELTQLTFSSYAGIDRTLFQDPALIHYESFDGLEVPAFLYLPPGYREGTRIPFIINAHGGPEGQFQPYFQRNIQYLLLNGYGLLAPNIRGSSGYGREYLSLDDYKKRKDSLKDYKAAADWLIDNGYTSRDQLGIRGGSYGGYVVLGMITEYPDLFAAAVDEVGIANFKTFLENTSDYRRALREAEYGPLSDPEFLTSISPIHKADQIRTPLLVVHGENDPRVPVDEARQILAAVIANGGEADSLIFSDEGHGSGKRVNIIREYRKQVAFFGRHLR